MKLFKKTEEKTVENIEKNNEEKVVESKETAIETVEQQPYEQEGKSNTSSEKSEQREENSQEAYHEGEFLDLANLLGKTVREIKDDCLLGQVRKIMQSISKVAVRYAPDKNQYLQLINISRVLEINEILLSPAYIKDFKKIAKKENFPMQKVSAIVDFPFGESLFARKVQEVKQLKREGVGNILVMMPVMMTAQEKIKQLKKETSKLLGLYKGKVGIAFSASDATIEQIKSALKAIEKLSIPSVTFVFGEIGNDNVEELINILVEMKGKKQISVLGNIKAEEAIIALKKAGVDKIYSSQAEEIGKALVQRFKIQGVNLK